MSAITGGACPGLDTIPVRSMETTAIAFENDNEPITVVISHLVKPGCEEPYEQWQRGISAAARQFEGHLGASFLRPTNPAYPEYVIIVKFDCYGHLKEWLESPIRQAWIEKATPLVQEDQKLQVMTGFETWFTLPHRPHLIPPKRYKMAILTTLAVFSVSQFLYFVFAGLLVGLMPLVRSFLIVALTVILLTYWVMPRITRLCYAWLYPKS